MKEKKVLQIVNLAPSESIVEKLTEIHPMRQVFWASVIQVVLLGFMLGSMALINAAI